MTADFKNTPNSVKFWNSVVILGLIASGFVSLDLLAMLFFIGSFLSLAIILQGDEENHYWMFGMPLVWLFVIIGLFVVLCEFIKERFILKFNAWLDREKTKDKK